MSTRGLPGRSLPFFDGRFYFRRLLGEVLANPVFVCARRDFQLPVRPDRSDQVLAHLGRQIRVLSLCPLQHLNRCVLGLLGLLFRRGSFRRPRTAPLELGEALVRYRRGSGGEAALRKRARGFAGSEGDSLHVHGAWRVARGVACLPPSERKISPAPEVLVIRTFPVCQHFSEWLYLNNRLLTSKGDLFISNHTLPRDFIPEVLPVKTRA